MKKIFLFLLPSLAFGQVEDPVIIKGKIKTSDPAEKLYHVCVPYVFQ